MERKGDPPLKFRYSRGNDIPTNHPNLDRALKLGQELRSNSTIVLPNVRDEKGEYAWNVEYLLDDKRAEQFLSYIKYLDVMKLRSVIVPERAFTQDTSTGSYAMAEAHADLFLLAEEGLISDCEDAINRYIIPPFVKYNFGMSAPPAIIDIAPITKENRQMLKEMVIEVMKAMAQNNEYFYFDIEKIAQELNVPIREIKKKEETEAEEKREYIKLELEKGRFWREPTEFEKKIDLAGIDKFLDDVQEKFQKDTGGLFDEMRDSAVRYLLPILEHKDIKGINDFTLKYKSQYTDIFKKYLRQCFDEGIQSVVKEFKAKVRDESIPQKQTQWLLGRAVSLSTKHTNEIQYKIVITCLSGIDAEKTAKTILFELNEIFEAYKGNEIANAISTETVTVLNRGRSLVADALKGWRRKV